MNGPQDQHPERRAPDEFVGIVKHYERRKTWHADSECAKLVEVEQRFKDGNDRMKSIEDKLDLNSAKTEATAEGVKEVLDILNLAKSFFRVLGLIGTLVKWLAVIAAPVIAVYYAIKGGGPK